MRDSTNHFSGLSVSCIDGVMHACKQARIACKSQFAHVHCVQFLCTQVLAVNRFGNHFCLCRSNAGHSHCKRLIRHWLHDYVIHTSYIYITAALEDVSATYIDLQYVAVYYVRIYMMLIKISR